MQTQPGDAPYRSRALAQRMPQVPMHGLARPLAAAVAILVGLVSAVALHDDASVPRYAGPWLFGSFVDALDRPPAGYVPPGCPDLAPDWNAAGDCSASLPESPARSVARAPGALASREDRLPFARPPIFVPGPDPMRTCDYAASRTLDPHELRATSDECPEGVVRGHLRRKKLSPGCPGRWSIELVVPTPTECVRVDLGVDDRWGCWGNRLEGQCTTGEIDSSAIVEARFVPESADGRRRARVDVCAVGEPRPAHARSRFWDSVEHGGVEASP